MRTFTRDFLTGLTALAGLAGLVTMLFLFGELTGVTERQIRFDLRLNTAAGLSEGSPVTVNGLRSGMVQSIEFAENPMDGVDLRVQLKASAKLPKNFTAVVSQSFVGETALELAPEPGQTPAEAAALVQDGERFTRTVTTTLEQLAGRIQGPIDTLSRSAARFDELAETYTEVGRRVNALLEPRTSAELAAGASPTIPSTLARLDKAAASADLWLGDATLRGNANELVERARGFIDRATETADAWKSTATTVDREAAGASKKLEEAAAELTRTLRQVGGATGELQQVLAMVRQGQGTVGQLVTNPDLYRSMNAAAERLNKVLLEAELLVEKFRKEGVPIQF